MPALWLDPAPDRRLPDLPGAPQTGGTVMGRRSRSRTIWPARQEAPAPRGVRVKVCAACRTQGSQLVRGPDRLLRCPVCIAQGIRQAAQALKSGLEAAKHAPSAVRTVERLVTRATQEKPHG